MTPQIKNIVDTKKGTFIIVDVLNDGDFWVMNFPEQTHASSLRKEDILEVYSLPYNVKPLFFQRIKKVLGEML